MVFFSTAAAFSLALSIGSMVEVPEEEARLIGEEFAAMIGDIDAVGIFIHNTLIALPMFIPGFGMAWGFFSAGSTGIVFSAFATLNPELVGIHPLSILFLTPFGLMELTAYSLGISRSYLLLQAILTKKPMGVQLRPTLVEAGIAVALLLAGGFVEYHLIQTLDPTLLRGGSSGDGGM